jgi:hypothetical protein
MLFAALHEFVRGTPLPRRRPARPVRKRCTFAGRKPLAHRGWTQSSASSTVIGLVDPRRCVFAACGHVATPNPYRLAPLIVSHDFGLTYETPGRCRQA